MGGFGMDVNLRKWFALDFINEDAEHQMAVGGKRVIFSLLIRGSGPSGRKASGDRAR